MHGGTVLNKINETNNWFRSPKKLQLCVRADKRQNRKDNIKEKRNIFILIYAST